MFKLLIGKLPVASGHRDTVRRGFGLNAEHVMYGLRLRCFLQLVDAREKRQVGVRQNRTGGNRRFGCAGKVFHHDTETIDEPFEGLGIEIPAAETVMESLFSDIANSKRRAPDLIWPGWLLPPKENSQLGSVAIC